MNVIILVGEVLCFVGILIGISAIDQLKREVLKMNANFSTLAEALDGIQSEIASEETVLGGVATLVDSVVLYLQGLPDLIKAAIADAIAKGVDPAILTGLSDVANKITADRQALLDKRDQLANAVASAPSGNVTPGAGVTTPAPVT